MEATTTSLLDVWVWKIPFTGLKYRFYLVGMQQVAEEGEYDMCYAKKEFKQSGRALQLSQLASLWMERLTVNLLDHDKFTTSGNKYIWVAMDYFQCGKK